MLSVKDAIYLKEYKIIIHFSDGMSGEIDFKDIIYSENRVKFTQLKDIEKFKDFKVDYTITWSNELDLAPEFLYFKAFKNNKEMKKQFKNWGYIT